MANQAAFTINGTPSSDPATGDRQYTALNGETLTVQLEQNPSAALSATFEVYDPTNLDSPLASKAVPLITWNENAQPAITVGPPPFGINDPVTIDIPAAQAPPLTGIYTYVIRCTVSTPGDGSPGSQVQVFERAVLVFGTSTTPPLRKTFPGETTQARARAWSDSLNDLIDAMENIILVGAGVTSFEGRLGAVVSQAGDYTAVEVDYDNAGSGLVATDVQAAIDEVYAAFGAYTLQDAYDAGNTIDVSVAEGALIIDAVDAVSPLTVRDGGSDVFVIDSAGGVLINPTPGQDLDMETFGAGAVSLTSGSDMDLIAAGGLSLSSGVGNDLTIDATAGELFLEDIGNWGGTLSQALDRTLDLTGAGQLYENITSLIGALNAAGNAIAGGLQVAYEADNSIAVTTAFGSVDLSNSADTTDLLTLTRTFAGAGRGLVVTMPAGGGGASHAGSGIFVDYNVTSGSGSAGIGIDVDGASDADGLDVVHNNSGGSGAVARFGNDIDTLIEAAADGGILVQANNDGTVQMSAEGTGGIIMGTLGTGNLTAFSDGGGIALNAASDGSFMILNAGGTTERDGGLLIRNRYPMLNWDYGSDTAVSVGIVANYDPTTNTDTVNGAYVAGVAATSNPTVGTTGAATFSAGDIIMFYGPTATANPGLYEVLSHAANVLTVRGVGLTDTVEDFTQRQFHADASDGASIVQVNVTVIRAGTDGVWETGSGSTTPITFTDLGMNASLQGAYNGGNTIDATVADGPVTIDTGTEAVAGLIVQDNSVTVFEVDSAGAVNIDPTSGQDFTVTTLGNADIDLISDGNMLMSGDNVVLAAAGFAIDVDTRIGGGLGAVSQNERLAVVDSNADTVEIFSVETAGTNGAKSRTYVGTRNPNGLVSAAPGSIYRRVNGTQSNVFVNNGTGTGTAWRRMAGLPVGYITEMVVAYATAATVTIAIGRCRADDDTADIIVTGTLTANITSSGANGLDTGSEAASTHYAVWAIGDRTGANAPAALLSLSYTAPTLPAGYNVKRLVGSVRNDGSSNFLPFVMTTVGRSRHIRYDGVAAATLQVLSSGSATTWTDVSLASLVPPPAREVNLLGRNGGDSLGEFGEVRTNGSTNGTPANRFYGAASSSETAEASSVMDVRADASRIIEYQVASFSADLDLWVRGYTLEI